MMLIWLLKVSAVFLIMRYYCNGGHTIVLCHCGITDILYR